MIKLAISMNNQISKLDLGSNEGMHLMHVAGDPHKPHGKRPYGNCDHGNPTLKDRYTSYSRSPCQVGRTSPRSRWCNRRLRSPRPAIREYRSPKRPCLIYITNFISSNSRLSYAWPKQSHALEWSFFSMDYSCLLYQFYMYCLGYGRIPS